MVEQKLCSTCKKHPRYGRQSKCHKCYTAYMAAYMIKRYHERRALAFELLGGACEDCGTAEGLEIDHVVAADKGCNFDRMTGYGMERFRKELMKCALRCRPCHIEKTIRCHDSGFEAVEHGGGVSGKRNCPCTPCKAKKAEYMRGYNRKRARVLGPVPQSGRGLDS